MPSKIFRKLDASALQKLSFQIAGSDNQVRLFGRGSIKTAQLGPFKVLRISSIEAGRSADEVNPVDDDIAIIYSLDGGVLTMASNFDKTRENRKPEVIVYTRVNTPKDSGENKLIGTWKLDLKLGDQNLDYELRIAKTDGKLNAVLVSPRSGEYKAKTIKFTDGKLLLEIDREVQNNPATFVYTGTLAGDELSGKLDLKVAGEEVSGTWTAKK